jgi:hypothetical protein
MFGAVAGWQDYTSLKSLRHRQPLYASLTTYFWDPPKTQAHSCLISSCHFCLCNGLGGRLVCFYREFIFLPSGNRCVIVSSVPGVFGAEILALPVRSSGYDGIADLNLRQ